VAGGRVRLAVALARFCAVTPVADHPLHLFAVSQAVGIQSTECGVISDVVTSNGEEWQSTWSVMLSAGGEGGLDPLAITGRIVEFYVQVLLPDLCA
jgi:hypothetical protein